MSSREPDKFTLVKASNVAPGAAELRFRGAWVTRAGLTPGKTVRVSNPSPGVIEIRLVEGAASGAIDPGTEHVRAALDKALENTTHLKETALGEFQVRSLRPVSLGPEFLCDTPAACARYHKEQIQSSPSYNPDVESFYVLALNTRRRVIGHTLISTGTIDTLLVHPSGVFRGAMAVNAAVLILFHNHPSGDATPSEADIKVTRDLIRAGQLMKCEVLDHVVMGTATAERAYGHVSLRELGYFFT